MSCLFGQCVCLPELGNLRMCTRVLLSILFVRKSYGSEQLETCYLDMFVLSGGDITIWTYYLLIQHVWSKSSSQLSISVAIRIL